MTKKEEQLELIPKKPTHGGARKGSGRKPKRKTTVIRIPDRYKHGIEQLVKFLDAVDERAAVKSKDGIYISDETSIMLEKIGAGKITTLYEPE